MRQNRVGEQKLFRLFGRFSLFIVVGFSTLYADGSFKDFKKFQADSFKTYKDKRDNAFNNYLKQQWESYNIYHSKPLYEREKPNEIISTTPKTHLPVGPKVSIKIKEKKEEQEEEKSLEIKLSDEKNTTVVTIEEVQKQIVQEEPKKGDLSFDFFGSKLSFDIPRGVKEANFYPQNQDGVANFFSVAASSDYESLLLNIDSISKKMNLNDWGIYLLVTDISQKIFQNQDNAKLFSWFVFNKLGYAVKVALLRKNIVLMHYSKKTIYSTPNYIFEGKKYYVVANYAKGEMGRVYSYKQDYPKATKELDLSLHVLPNFEKNIEEKELVFSHLGSKYTIPIKYNKNLIDFMHTYPQADYETFFNAPLQDETYRDIALSLKQYLDGKKASEAINFVLNFVQNAFKYETDNRQFGREKVMFAQETLYFDKSDCEDRAILYSYLVKELFGITILGVKYDDHMATALYVPIDGDTIRVASKEYVIADPTYINAAVGMSMPRYKDVRPNSYIFLKNN